MHVHILKTGDTYPRLAARRGDFEAWFMAGLDLPRHQFTVLDARTAALPDPVTIGALVVTGSPAAVHDHAPWSDQAGQWMRAVVEAGRPLLGVCYGHQLLAFAMGGQTGPNPQGREVGVVQITREGDTPLLDGLSGVFPAYATHRDAVLVPPPHARILAGNANSPFQALAYGERAFTLQFHPEFDADVMRGYIDERAAELDAESGPGTADALRAQVVPLGTGAVVFRNFLALCRQVG